MIKRDLNLEELEWSDDEEFDINEETLVRFAVETLQGDNVDPVDVEATKVIPAAAINARVSTDTASSQVQDLLDIIDAQEEKGGNVPDITENLGNIRSEKLDLGATRVIPTVAADVEDVMLTEEEAAELGDLSYHDEDVMKPRRTSSAPKKRPEQARTKASANKTESKAVDIQLTEEEKNGAVVIRDGVPYLILGTGKTFLNSVHYQEGWMPPKK